MNWIKQLFSRQRLYSDLSQEIQEHLAEKIDELTASGMSREEATHAARREFGNATLIEERGREAWQWPSIENVLMDARYGLRQFRRNRATATVAVVSLALAMGACVSAFRLIDALLLRPLPISTHGRLFVLSRSNADPTQSARQIDGWAYPDFALMRDAVKQDADLIALSYTQRTDLTYASEDAMEEAYVQYVSGSMFEDFGLQPALGRLLMPADDRTPGAHPVAVVSYDYWTRRLGRDPRVIGRTFRLGDQAFEIVGVAPRPFTGTEPGIPTDVFLPTMMHRWVTRADATWHRTLAIVHPGVPLGALGAKLQSISNQFERQRLKGNAEVSKQLLDNSVNRKLFIEPAASGVSVMQQDYRTALVWLTILVGLVLLIACVNVANLMTALGRARAREMALRVAIGAGRGRLVQLVLVESAMLAFAAGLLGAGFAQWSAPWVARSISTPDYPARFSMPADWRVLGFGAALCVVVVLLFGLAPALGASGVRPASVLKGGDDPSARHRFTHILIAAQVAFCFLVVFAGGLFVATFQRLEHRPLGFDPSHLILLETVAPQGRTPVAWAQMADSLRATPGVAEVAESGWPLVRSGAWGGAISVAGGPPSEDLGYFLTISPGWLATMKMRLLAGRDFSPQDSFPGAAIVNQTFVKEFLKTSDPVGMVFEQVYGGQRQRCQVIGVVPDAPYRLVHEAMLPVAFVPFRQVDDKAMVLPQYGGTFAVRTKEDNPSALETDLRRKVSQADAGFRVSSVETQQELLDVQTVRERLLANLGVFFAAAALLLAAIGLYGVISYTVAQRTNEIGIRMALGARRFGIVRLILREVAVLIGIGVAIGAGLALGGGRAANSLLYGLKANDPFTLALAAILLTAIGLAATFAPARRATKVDPMVALRYE